MYRDGVTIFPDNLAFGTAEDPSLAYQAGEIAANELRALGTDINFALIGLITEDQNRPNQYRE
jgi:beta-N-acetylhexosaminidase